MRDNQRVALEALAEGCTTIVAAERAGVVRQTVHRWRREDERFRAALAEQRRELVIDAVDLFKSHVDRAARTVLQVMSGEIAGTDARTRLAAAEAVLGRVGWFNDEQDATVDQREVRRRINAIWGTHATPEPDDDDAAPVLALAEGE